MKKYTITFVTTDEFDPILEEFGRKQQKDGKSYLKALLERYVTALVGGRYLQDFTISYQTVKPVKK
ncbi:hypothetical protein LCGC14_0894910 [marine sediment metagenome]|uniref:Uncharacterized protein n=1 Tax=marine sediment metagenome TaxID=412755 RepID=A0A0F9RHB6_9ZZZZ